MQGRTISSNSERKGPHKSMHCKFCKPPGAVMPEKPTKPQLETKTKMHLAHEAADLKLFQVHDEPGFPAVETEACVCILEGDNACPKCAPDKIRGPIKKKVCTCPKGAKQHPNMYDAADSKKKNRDEEDDEFWWEKYSREHDALAKETWAAYMAQRRKEKRLLKCEKREHEKLIAKRVKGTPDWYQKLSCQQMIYVEFLSTAIRLDSDENVTDRTHFILAGIGLYPRPKRKILKKCLRYCHYNSIQFLNQLNMLLQYEDPFREKYIPPNSNVKTVLFSWNERLIMNSMCHLEFPGLLRELMDRLPRLDRGKVLPQIPYPVFKKLPKMQYENPYEEPIWQDRLNWIEKRKIDRENRCRAHMITKRVKIPPLALVRRCSLIDARPPFLSQIEANERASRRMDKGKRKQRRRKRPIPTFNSAVDVTAIANIEASDISTTDKADTDEICVFLREPIKEPEMVEEEEEEGRWDVERREEEEEVSVGKEVKFLQEPDTLASELDRSNSDLGENSQAGEAEEETEMQDPCLALLDENEEATKESDETDDDCKFRPFVSSSTQTMETDFVGNMDILKPVSNEKKKVKKVRGKKGKKKARKRKRKTDEGRKRKKKRVTKKKPKKVKQQQTNLSNLLDGAEADEGKTEEEGEIRDAEGEIETEVQMEESYSVQTPTEKQTRKDSESSDPDTEDLWSSRPPCTSELSTDEEKQTQPEKRKKRKKSVKGKRRKVKKKKKKCSGEALELREESREYLKKKEEIKKADKVTMTECYEGQYDHLYKKEGDKPLEGSGKKEEESVFKGKVQLLLDTILRDLADEGYISASYPGIQTHPDIDQLIMHLKGVRVTKALKAKLLSVTKARWTDMKELVRTPIPDLGLSLKKAATATWNDKKYIFKLAEARKDEFYFKIAKDRSDHGRDIYNTLYQGHFGTGRYLKIFYAYMTSKFEDAILRGID